MVPAVTGKVGIAGRQEQPLCASLGMQLVHDVTLGWEAAHGMGHHQPGPPGSRDVDPKQESMMRPHEV